MSNLGDKSEDQTTSPAYKIRVVDSKHEYTLNDVMQEMRYFHDKFEQKLDDLRAKISLDMEEKILALRNEFYDRFEELESRCKHLEDKVTSIQVKQTDYTQRAIQGGFSDLDDCDRCVIVRGLKYEQGENLDVKIATLLSTLGPDVQSTVNVVSFERKQARGTTPGLVKIAFETKEQKILVLRAKSRLAGSSFSRVYIGAGKSHIERVLENNIKTVLNMIPDGNQYRLTGSGRLIRKQANQNNTSVNDGQGPRNKSMDGDQNAVGYFSSSVKSAQSLGTRDQVGCDSSDRSTSYVPSVQSTYGSSSSYSQNYDMNFPPLSTTGRPSSANSVISSRPNMINQIPTGPRPGNTNLSPAAPVYRPSSSVDVTGRQPSPTSVNNFNMMQQPQAVYHQYTVPGQGQSPRPQIPNTRHQVPDQSQPQQLSATLGQVHQVVYNMGQDN